MGNALVSGYCSAGTIELFTGTEVDGLLEFGGRDTTRPPGARGEERYFL